MGNNQLLTYVIIGVAAYFLFTSGAFGELFSSTPDDVDDLYPADLKTTITLNTGDEFATSTTDVIAKYYVFSSSGEFLKSGTTASGTASFTVPTGGDYKLITFNDTSSGAAGKEYLAKEIEFSTDGADPTKRAVQTVNIDLRKSSATTISKVRNPIDLDSNITCSADSACHFDVMISATTANAAVGKPVILISVNSTEFDDITMSGLSEVTCPQRVTPTVAGRIHYCFETGKDLLSKDGIVMYTGTLSASSTGPSQESTSASASAVNFTVLDTAMYAESDYKTKGYSAFKYATENPSDHSDIGSADSSVSTLIVD